jgi:hypothetical protein
MDVWQLPHLGWMSTAPVNGVIDKMCDLTHSNGTYLCITIRKYMTLTNAYYTARIEMIDMRVVCEIMNITRPAISVILILQAHYSMCC